MVTGHGNNKSYLRKYKIIDSPMCSCKSGEHTIYHLLFDCELMEQERDRLKAAVFRSENWPVRVKIYSSTNIVKALKNSRTVYPLINYREQNNLQSS
jgi:hypothetical protein